MKIPKYQGNLSHTYKFVPLHGQNKLKTIEQGSWIVSLGFYVISVNFYEFNSIKIKQYQDKFHGTLNNGENFTLQNSTFKKWYNFELHMNSQSNK